MKKWFTNIVPLLFCAILVSALSSILFKMLEIDSALLQVFIWTLAVIVPMSFILLNIRAVLVFAIVIIVAASTFYITANEQIKQLFFSFILEIIAFLFEGETLSSEFLLPLKILLVLLISIVFYIPCVSFPFFPAIFSMAIAFILVQWDKSSLSMLQEALIVLTVLIVFYARTSKEEPQDRTKSTKNSLSLWITPLVVLIILIVGYIAQNSALNKKWEWFEVRANIVADYFKEITGNAEPRTIFDLSQTGYQPLSGRLGGPAELSDKEVMQVDSDYSLLLRGSIKNTYTGYSWIDDSVSYRARMISKFKELQNEVFNLNLPEQNSKDVDFFDTIEIKIRTLSDGNATVFAPNRVISIRPEKALTMLISFNSEGEVFASRDIPAETSYTIISENLNYGKNGFDDYYAVVRSNIDINNYLIDELVLTNYTTQFNLIPQRIVTLANEITAGMENDYQKANAIKTYLEEGFVYTLTPDIPPDGYDFVEYFIETKEGYCTYFASAMAVMARAAGLPSRYVEGFKIDADNIPGYQQVTAENAHAWAEVYIVGLGWIPFDPAVSSNQTTEEAIVQTEDEPLPEEIMEPQESVVFPEDLQVKSSSSSYIVALILAILLFISVVLLIPGISKVITKINYYKNRKKSVNHAVLFFYKDLMILFAILKYPKPYGSTLKEYAIAIDERFPLPRYSYSDVASSVSEMLYADASLDLSQLKSIREYHSSIIRHVKKNSGFFKYIEISLKLIFREALLKNLKLF